MKNNLYLFINPIQVKDEEREIVAGIEQKWHDLVLESKNVDASLIVVKRKFTEVKTDQSLLDVQDSWLYLIVIFSMKKRILWFQIIT